MSYFDLKMSVGGWMRILRSGLPLLVVAAFASQATAQGPMNGPLENVVNFVSPDAGNEWHVSVDSVFMNRSDNMSSVLIRNAVPGTAELQTKNLDLGTMVGPMVNVFKDGPEGWGVGARYFGLLAGNTAVSRVTGPGQSFVQNFNGFDNSDQDQFDAHYNSGLQNFELNVRRTVHPGAVVYAGYRFIELDENFMMNTRANSLQIAPSETVRTQVSNQLHGAQIGTNIILIDADRFTLNFGGSTGVYSNHVNQTLSGYSDGSTLAKHHLGDTQLSFATDANLIGVYRIVDHLSLRAGFQVMVLNNVALAPEQAQFSNYKAGGPFHVNAKSDAIYYGAIAGLQWDF